MNQTVEVASEHLDRIAQPTESISYCAVWTAEVGEKESFDARNCTGLKGASTLSSRPSTWLQEEPLSCHAFILGTSTRRLQGLTGALAPAVHSSN